MKHILLLSLFLLMSACTQTSFNEKYQSSGWSTVLVAPFSGKQANRAQIYFEHALATSNQLSVIPPNAVLQLLKEHELHHQFLTAPEEALFALASKINANGLIFGELKTSEKTGSFTRSTELQTVSLFVKLVDVKSKATVASSLHDSSSLFLGTESLIESVTSDVAHDFKRYFQAIK
ncbi:hypothetical protein PALB_18740 [Pseudoalteromonas luteoviolacea B = ATCC 29581]|nr:hypothetical protein PALB_18740 [Pseudoalteromonas luteoviolacea B = ATCC 29581]